MSYCYSQKIKKLNRWRSLYSSDFMPQMTKPEFQMTHIIRPIDKLFLEEAPPNVSGCVIVWQGVNPERVV